MSKGNINMYTVLHKTGEKEILAVGGADFNYIIEPGYEQLKIDAYPDDPEKEGKHTINKRQIEIDLATIKDRDKDGKKEKYATIKRTNKQIRGK